MEILAKKIAFRKIIWVYTSNMITLFTRQYCPYCDKVKTRIEELAIPYTEKGIDLEENLGELLEKGGKRQVPYLIDDEHGVSMYESDSIVSYLESIKR